MGHVLVPAAEELLDLKFPILDHGHVILVDYMGGDQRIAEAAWVSSIDEVDAAQKTEVEIKRIVNYMMSHRHTSPFEQVSLTFRCKMPIFVARQWVRHRTARLNEMSGRYRILPMQAYVPPANRLKGKGTANKQGSEGEIETGVKRESIIGRMVEGQGRAYEDYRWFDAAGLANELCRINVPVSQYTEWVWNIDLHNFFHFSGLRMDSHAQWEIRQYANKMFEIVEKIAPIACDAWMEHFFLGCQLNRAEKEALSNSIYLLLKHADQNLRFGFLNLRRKPRNELLLKLGLKTLHLEELGFAEATEPSQGD